MRLHGFDIREQEGYPYVISSKDIVHIYLTPASAISAAAALTELHFAYSPAYWNKYCIVITIKGM